jgi:hypothetical protein
MTNDDEHNQGSAFREETGRARLKTFLSNDMYSGTKDLTTTNNMNEHSLHHSKPIADLFPAVRHYLSIKLRWYKK